LPAAVLQDVLEEYITPEQALQDYGVMIIGEEVDVEGTAKERRKRERTRNYDIEPVTFDMSRLNYEAKLPIALQEAMVGAILDLPTSYREFFRGELWKKIRGESDSNGTSPSPDRVPNALNEIAAGYGMSLAQQ